MVANTRTSGTDSVSSPDLEVGLTTADHPVQDSVDHPAENSTSNATGSTWQQSCRQPEALVENDGDDENDESFGNRLVRSSKEKFR